MNKRRLRHEAGTSYPRGLAAKNAKGAKKGAGVPLAIHNIGSGTQEEEVLFAYPLTGHYRIP
jgi:uncharacterized protein YijF (DUF1287 family)